MNNINTQNPMIGGDFPMPGLMDLGAQGSVDKLTQVVASFLETGLMVTTAPKGTELNTLAETKNDEKVDLPAPQPGLLTEANIEGLVALLKLTVDEKQAKALKERIAGQQSQIDNAASARMKKIEKNLADMDKAAAQKRLQQALGWLGVFVAVVVAIVSVATCGLAASVLPIVTAGIAAVMQTLDQVGVMDKAMKELAKLFQDWFGLSKNQAQCAAAIFMAVAMIAVTCGGVAGVAKFAKDLPLVLRIVSTIAQGSVGVANAAVGIKSAFDTKDASNNEAELKEIEKFLRLLQKKLADSEDDLQNILQMLEDGFSKMLAFVDSKLDSQMTIAMSMKKMA